MKYIVILYIALGFVLSSAVGIEYSCNGAEIFPEYTGSPFIFRQKSLGSSMTYFYSLYGLLINTAIWTIILLLIRRSAVDIFERTGMKTIYRGIVGALILFTTLNIAIDYIMLGRGFGKGLNYWYFDLEKESADSGVNCIGNWGMFLFPK